MNELIPNFGFIAFIFAGCSLAVGLMLIQAQKSYRTQLNYLNGTLATELATKKQMQEDFRALLSCSRNMGRRMNQTIPNQESIASTSRSTATPTIRTPLNLNEPAEINAGDKVHELVAHGLSVDEVASVCGLTRGEVDFLSRFISAGNGRHAA